MLIPQSPEEILTLLAAHRMIGAAPRAELEWIAARCQVSRFEVGMLIVNHTVPVVTLEIIVRGRIVLHVNRGSGWRKAMEIREGEITGLLPFSRLVFSPGDSIAEEETVSVSLHQSHFPELIWECPLLTSIMVNVMLDRARMFNAGDLHDEKMMSLGKLASGLAHELNNPASAASRSARALVGNIETAETAARALAAAQLSEEQLAMLDRVRNACALSSTSAALSSLERADREDQFAEWLEHHCGDSAAAEALAGTAITISTLDQLATVLSGTQLSVAVRWMSTGCALRALSQEIESATARIHNLVGSVKGFTFMDREAVAEQVDITKGLHDTIAVLRGKADAKSVSVTINAEADLPNIHGFGSELNQIWEKLLDNAIDAVEERGQVAVAAAHEGGFVVVRVLDNGQGIPAENLEKIFDPFFTTKPVGKGTGLGFDIVRRLVRWHEGEVVVNSKPGKTVFRVNLPIVRGK